MCTCVTRPSGMRIMAVRSGSAWVSDCCRVVVASTVAMISSTRRLECDRMNHPTRTATAATTTTGSADRLAALGLARLNLERLERLGREELFRLQPALGKSLLVVIAQECIEYRAIRRDAVRPPVLAHLAPRFLHMRDQPGQHRRHRRRLAVELHRMRLRLLERLVERLRDPAVLLVDVAADDHRLHDGKDPGAPVMLASGRDVVGK